MNYTLRLNVHHDGHFLPKGSECPPQFVKPLLEQGLLAHVPESCPALPVCDEPVHVVMQEPKKKKKVT